MNSLAQQIESHLRHGGDEWHHKGTLTADITWAHITCSGKKIRYLPDTVSRALRSLEEQSVIAVKSDGSKSILYKWLPNDLRKSYIPFSERPSHDKINLFKK